MIRFSATAAPDGKSIVVYGGLNTSSTDTFDSSSDVFVLDTCNLEWSKPDVGGDAPAPRADHGAVTYGNYMVLLYGTYCLHLSFHHIHTFFHIIFTYISFVSHRLHGCDPYF